MTSKIAGLPPRLIVPPHLIEVRGTYAGLATVALEVLREAHEAYGARFAMVCGPLTTGGLGCSCKNTALFSLTIDALARDLRLRGSHYSVFDQLVFQRQMEIIIQRRANDHEYDMEILTGFYGEIFRSGLVKALYFLPLWVSSIGACWEWEEADRLGIPRVVLSQDFVARLDVPSACTCCAS